MLFLYFHCLRRNHSRQGKYLGIILGLIGLFSSFPLSAFAVNRPTLIEDTEIHDYLRVLAAPIFKAAGLNPSSVSIYIVRDSRVNAFVTEGQRLFVNTGLILYAHTPGEIRGVIAHETGHMAAGHLIRFSNARAGLNFPVILSTILGIAAIAMGAGDPGVAIMAAGQQISLRNTLSYSRVQEASADQAAATYLQRAHLSGRGLLKLFARFASRESGKLPYINPFLLNHPLSQSRFNSLKNRVQNSPYYNQPTKPLYIHELSMIQAKLYAFLTKPIFVFDRYPKIETTKSARYAHAIAYHRDGSSQKALAQINSLVKQEPKNPYILQVKGQILFESGQAYKALLAYTKAIKLHPRSVEFLVDAVQAITNLPSDYSRNRKALRYLRKASVINPYNPFVYYEFALIYGRMNRIGMAELTTARRYSLLGYRNMARKHAKKALKILGHGSPGWIRAQDIIIFNR